MPIASRPSSSRRLRAAGPQGRGAVSSLLRLSQQAASRLPSGSDLTGWMSRAAGLLNAQPESVFAASVLSAEPNSSIITRLLPSHELRRGR
jgi:hypothetical protein